MCQIGRLRIICSVPDAQALLWLRLLPMPTRQLCLLDAFQAFEFPEQCFSRLMSDALDGIQCRRHLRLAAFVAVVRDAEPVRLVAQVLYQP